MEIKDSGERREFSTGAVRDIQEGKGRCDLIPIDIVAPLMEKQDYANVLHHISLYLEAGYDTDLYHALTIFATVRNWSIPVMILEVSKQYEEGAQKYGEHNWEKGIPLHCYIDSAVRHFLKFVDGWDDEPHDRAFVWNILGALWTQANMPKMVDLEFPQRIVTSSDTDSCPGVESNDNCESIQDNAVTIERSKLLSLIESLGSLTDM